MSHLHIFGLFMRPGEASVTTNPASDRNADAHPSAASLSEPSKGGKEDPEGSRGCLNKSDPPSNCKDQEVNRVRSTTQDVTRDDAYRDDMDFTVEVNPLLDPSERGYDGSLSRSKANRSLLEANRTFFLPPYQSPQGRHLVGNPSRIVQAKLQAEEAAMLAASEISRSQSIWSQLTVQNSSGVGLDGEANLGSAAVAVVAACSVVKAAAAVSKVASDASLQAKLMVEESLIACNSKESTQSSGIAPAFRKPENLDAIIKATKLLAEAVSQVVKIMAMGEPIPRELVELVEAGPSSYWDGPHISSELLSELTNVTEGERASTVEDERVDVYGDHMNVQPSFEKETRGHDEVETSQEKNINGASLVEGVTPRKKRAKLAVNGAEFLELNEHFYADNRYSENTRLQEPNSSGSYSVSIVDTRRKNIVEYKSMANGKEAHHISDGSLSVNSNDGMVHHLTNVPSITQKENIPENISLRETCPLINTHSKRKASSSAEADVVAKGKVASSGEKSVKNEVKVPVYNNNAGKLVSEASEPRRSNRIMQPTSRLLEGLQTSSMSRMPSVTHEKGTKAGQWSKSRGNNRAERNNEDS